MTTSGVKANGDLYTDTAEYVRTAGTSGLMGAWKSTEVKLSSPNEFSIQESGLDRLILKIPALKATCEVTSDGKEVAVEGPDIPTGLRLSLTRTGPYSFRLVQKMNGTVISSSVYTVSEDRADHDRGGRGPRGSARDRWSGKSNNRRAPTRLARDPSQEYTRIVHCFLAYSLFLLQTSHIYPVTAHHGANMSLIKSVDVPKHMADRLRSRRIAARLSGGAAKQPSARKESPGRFPCPIAPSAAG